MIFGSGGLERVVLGEGRAAVAWPTVEPVLIAVAIAQDAWGVPVEDDGLYMSDVEVYGGMLSPMASVCVYMCLFSCELIMSAVNVPLLWLNRTR